MRFIPIVLASAILFASLSSVAAKENFAEFRANTLHAAPDMFAQLAKQARNHALAKHDTPNTYCPRPSVGRKKRRKKFPCTSHSSRRRST